MAAFWYWWIAAGMLLVVEILSVHFLALLLAFVAALMGVLVYFNPQLSAAWQALLFGILLLPTLFLWRKIVQSWRRHEDGTAARLNLRGLNHIGQRYVLQEALQQHRGRIQIGDTFWKIKSASSFLAAGTEIEIESLENDIFVVRPVA